MLTRLGNQARTNEYISKIIILKLLPLLPLLLLLLLLLLLMLHMR